MEAGLFYLDCLLLALLCWYVVRAEGTKGPRHLGFFAYEDRREAPPPSDKSAKPAKTPGTPPTPQPPKR
jgi:hypothetical protein